MRLLSRIFPPMSGYKWLVWGFFVTSVISLTACNHILPKTTNLTSTPYQPQVTETNPAGVTPEVSETPFVEMTPTVEVIEEGEISAERKAEIVSNVNAFLNAEGRFSDEELRKNKLWFQLDVDPKEPLPLGVLHPSFSQGILVDFLYETDATHYLIGTYDVNGERIVIDFSQTIDFSPAYATSISALVTADKTLVKLESWNDFVVFLDDNVGNPFLFGLSYYRMPELTEEDIQAAIAHGYDPVDVAKRIEYLNSHLEYSRDVFALLNKDNLDPGFVLSDDVNQTDNLQSVIVFDSDHNMKIEDIDMLVAEPPMGVTNLYIRIPY